MTKINKIKVDTQLLGACKYIEYWDLHCLTVLLRDGGLKLLKSLLFHHLSFAVNKLKDDQSDLTLGLLEISTSSKNNHPLECNCCLNVLGKFLCCLIIFCHVELVGVIYNQHGLQG